MKMGSLYSGAIDGFAYAAKKLGIYVSWQVENEKEYHRYLKKNYPESKKYQHDGSIGKRNLEWVNIICGGDPCQPHSVAGVRRGKTDDNYRWPEMFRITSEIRPNWVINENVAGTISNMVLDQKISDLESIGYTCQAFDIPAVAVNACHQRQRIFLVAHTDVQRRKELLYCDDRGFEKAFGKTNTLDTSGNPFLRFQESMGEPALFPMDDGLSDRVLRLGAAGNSIVSEIPLILLSAIKYIETTI